MVMAVVLDSPTATNPLALVPPISASPMTRPSVLVVSNRARSCIWIFAGAPVSPAGSVTRVFAVPAGSAVSPAALKKR